MIRQKVKGAVTKVVKHLPTDLAVDLLHWGLLPRDLMGRRERVTHKNPGVERERTNDYYSRTTPLGHEGHAPSLKDTRERFEAVSRYVQGNVVEIGCADGYFSRRFAKRGHSVTGIDFSTHNIRLAQSYAKRDRISNARFVMGTVEALPVKSRSADTVFLGEILEHVRDPVHLLQEARRVVRPGGRIIITLPTHLTISADHRRTVTPRMLRKWLKPVASIEKLELINMTHYYCIAKVH